MKKFFFFLFFFFPFPVFASGGSTLVIQNISYSPEKNIIRYEQYFSGGYAPVIPWTFDVEVKTEKETLIFDPETAEKIFHDDEKSTAVQKAEWRQKVLQKEYPEKLKELNLEKLGFSATAKMLSDNLEHDYVKNVMAPPGFMGLEYQIQIFRNGKFLKSIGQEICLDSNPVNIRGYGKAGGNFVFLVITYRGDCYGEGLPGAWETGVLVKNISVSPSDILEKIHDPIFPEGISEEEICCPIGVEIFPSPHGILLSIPKNPSVFSDKNPSIYFNTKGKEEVADNRMYDAMTSFERAAELSDEIGMAHFNAACAASLGGEPYKAHQYIDEIVDSGNGALMKKIFLDKNLKEYRGYTGKKILLHFLYTFLEVTIPPPVSLDTLLQEELFQEKTRIQTLQEFFEKIRSPLASYEEHLVVKEMKIDEKKMASQIVNENRIQFERPSLNMFLQLSLLELVSHGMVSGKISVPTAYKKDWGNCTFRIEESGIFYPSNAYLHNILGCMNLEISLIAEQDLVYEQKCRNGETVKFDEKMPKEAFAVKKFLASRATTKAEYEKWISFEKGSLFAVYEKWFGWNDVYFSSGKNGERSVVSALAQEKKEDFSDFSEEIFLKLAQKAFPEIPVSLIKIFPFSPEWHVSRAFEARKFLWDESIAVPNVQYVAKMQELALLEKQRRKMFPQKEMTQEDWISVVREYFGENYISQWFTVDFVSEISLSEKEGIEKDVEKFVQEWKE